MEELRAFLVELEQEIDSCYPTEDFAEGIEEGLKQAADLVRRRLGML